MTHWVQPDLPGERLDSEAPLNSSQSSAFDIKCCAWLTRQDDHTIVDNAEFFIHFK